MKLISLNTWGGKYFEPLINFIRQQSEDTDIFCLLEIYDTNSNEKQYKEIRANLLFEIKNILPDFQAFYYPILFDYDNNANLTDFDLKYGQAIFVKKSITINNYKGYIICNDYSQEPFKKDFSNLTTPLQYLNLTAEKKEYSLFVFHGTPYPADKLDSPRHLSESKKVKEIIDSQEYAKILVGDFNLLPQTQSIKLFETNMRNLIKEFNIEKTRSNLSPFYGGPDFQKFADYIFVSKNINVKSFEVPDVKISDHLPMILEFS